MLSLSRSRSRSSRLSHSPHKWGRHWRWTLLFLRPTGSSCGTDNRNTAPHSTCTLTCLQRTCPNAGPHAVPQFQAQQFGAGRGAMGPGRGGFGMRGGFQGGVGGPRPATCYKCGGPNHYARDCQAQAMKCYACGKLVGWPLDKTLRLCKANEGKTGPYLTRLHCTQWRATQLCRQGVLQMWSSWTHLTRLHCCRN